MVLGEFLYVMLNSSGVRMNVLVLFKICDKVVIPYVYNLSKYFWDCVFEWSEKVWYMGLVFHIISSGVFLIGKVLFVVVTCISYSLWSRKSVRAIGDSYRIFHMWLEEHLTILQTTYVEAPSHHKTNYKHTQSKVALL